MPLSVSGSSSSRSTMPPWCASNCLAISGLKSSGGALWRATLRSSSCAYITGTRKLTDSPSRRRETLMPATVPLAVTLGPPLMPELIGPLKIRRS